MTIPESKVDILDQSAKKKSPFPKKKLLYLCEFMIICYVLFEVLRPGEINRLFVYKVVIGVGLFFYLLIQTTISNAFYAICQMKMSDLELFNRMLNAFVERNGDTIKNTHKPHNPETTPPASPT